MTFENEMWRAQGVYRVLALVYAAVLYLREFRDYAHPLAGWAGVALMAAWTAVTLLVYARPAGRSWPVLVVDLAIGVALVVGSRWLNDLGAVEAGAPTLPTIWVSAAVLAWAIRGGPLFGVTAAALLGAANIVERGEVTAENVHNIVLLGLAGLVVGYGAELARASEATLGRALQVEAATRERERLARGIHDSVLQVLALVQRRGGELGGEAAELGRLAGEQEVALRSLVTAGHDRELADGDPERLATARDLRSMLRNLSSTQVTVAAPATPVMLPTGVAAEITAAVQAALDNVRTHAGEGAQAWVLVEDEPDAVVVTVRDDGPGIAAGRLGAAEAEGRLGVSQSIRGRLRDLGGEVVVNSAPGHGTEVELRLPRS